MPRVKILFLGSLIVMSFWILVIPSAFATEDTCTCFCGYDEKGAVSKGDMTPSQCQDKCLSENAAMIVCASSASQWPDQDPWCFKSEVTPPLLDTCEQIGGDLDMDYQPPQCMPGSYFCYPNAADNKYTLQVSVGGLVEVGDLGDYISSMYTWLLTTMVVVAIVMIMVYGFMYIFSAGFSAAAKKATDGMKRVVFGLVLLFCAVALLQLINPYLIKLQMPQIPMMRPVLLGSDSSCEDLIEQGFTIDEGHQDLKEQSEAYGNNKCGSVTPVLLDPGGQDVLEGTTCRFTTCAEDGNQCATTLEGKGLCVSCVEVEPDNEFGLEPSLSNCMLLDTEDEYGSDGEPMKMTGCYYTHEPDLIVQPGTVAIMVGLGFVGGVVPTSPQGLAMYGLAAESAQDVYIGSCAYVEMDCTGMTSCRDYDDVIADNNREGACLDDILTMFPGNGNLYFEDICEADLCGLAPEGETCVVSAPTEHWTDAAFYVDCVNSSFMSEAADLLAGQLRDKYGEDIDWSEGLLPEGCYLQ